MHIFFPAVQGWNLASYCSAGSFCNKFNHLSWIDRQFLQASICFRRAADAGHVIAEYWRRPVVPSRPGISFDFQCNSGNFKCDVKLVLSVSPLIGIMVPHGPASFSGKELSNHAIHCDRGSSLKRNMWSRKSSSLKTEIRRKAGDRLVAIMPISLVLATLGPWILHDLFWVS